LTLFVDTCDQTLFDCNTAFHDCVFNACEAEYTGTDLSTLMGKLGCEFLASTFSEIVEGEIGRFFFSDASSERCGCDDEDEPDWDGDEIPPE
jgi:hypothetical protein